MKKEDISAILDRVRTWPQARQEDVVRILLEMERQDTSIHRLSPAERAAVERSREQARRGEFATDEEMKALFELYRE